VDRPTSIPLRIGAWRVDPAAGQMSRDGEIVRLEARTMRLLLCLAQHAGEVVSIDQLLDQVWTGVVVTPDSVYQAVASLRRLLGDDARQPQYIANVPRLGYRLIAPVRAWNDEPVVTVSSQWSDKAAPRSPSVDGAGRLASQRTAAPHAGPPANASFASHTDPPAEAVSAPRAGPEAAGELPLPSEAVVPAFRRRAALVTAGAVLCLALVVAFMFHGTGANDARTSAPSAAVPQKSVAVLPFLDLTTQEMNEEYFADGMTEELIGKLSQIPGVRVPAATSSFYFKGKQVTVAEVAKSLGVAYVLDGSIRKSDSMLRVAARLVRADDGYVVWSHTYDRPADDKLWVQDDIATEVTKALQPSLR
jgi:transcriptional activator of cad operon